MQREEILSKINSIFEDILDLEDLKIEESTTADDIEEWDSLTHIRLVVDIEKSFGIRFNSKEIQSWKYVGEMINSILDKI